MKRKSHGFYAAMILGGASTVFIAVAAVVMCRCGVWEREIAARKAVLESLAVSFLAVTSECNSARNPLEGICNSAGDIPGGYPYHSSCDIVSPPEEILRQQMFTMEKE